MKSNDDTNEFRDEIQYKSLVRQSQYILHNKCNDELFVGGVAQYLELILHSLKHYPNSQSRTETLHSVSVGYLVQFLCILYPSISGQKSMISLINEYLFSENNLELFYARQLNDSFLARTEISKLFAIIALFDYQLQDSFSIIDRYERKCLQSLSSQLHFQWQTTKLNGKPSKILNGTLEQIWHLDGILRCLSSILSAKLFVMNDGNTILYSFIAWLNTIFILSNNLDLIETACYCISMFGKYMNERLLDDKQLDVFLNNENDIGLKLDLNAQEISCLLNTIQCCCCAAKVNANTDGKSIKKLSNVNDILSYLVNIVQRYHKNHRQISESAISALSSLAKGTSTFKQLKKVEESIFELRNLSEEELQFGIGSVLSNIIISAHSISKNTEFKNAPPMKKIRISETKEKESNNNGNSDGTEYEKYIDLILDRICLQDMRYGSKIVRCSSCLWLLCIVRFTAHLSSYMQSKLLMIQQSFINALTDSNQFTVECASKGLAYVYEKSETPDLKSDLIDNLMRTLGKGKRIIHSDTEVEHKEGKSTFKELCQIANNLKQPKLAYQFLDLAASHSIWNSKRGAAFSLGSLLKISNSLTTEMDLEEIIPILYRYKYDINPNVRSTMKNLWISIVGNNEEYYVDKYFDSIFTLIIIGLQDKQWRVRAATPLAVCDLILGQRLPKLKVYLSELWINLFLVIDDINVMVKKSAAQMSQSLMNVTSRLVDPNLSPADHVKQTLDIIIPLILEKGIDTRVKSVQLLSIYMLVKICDKSQLHLRPYLHDLIRVLVQGLSNFEPSQLGYLATQDFDDDTSGRLEDARLQISRSNPLNSALSSCAELLDSKSLNEVIPELTNIIRIGVGLNSINACCKLLNDLAEKKRFHSELRKHSKRVMNAVCSQISITNSKHLQTIYSGVIGRWCVFSKKKYVSNCADLIYSMYFGSGGSQQQSIHATVDVAQKRIVSGMIAHQFSRYALTVFATYAKLIALAFVACHDSNKDAKEVWENVINECGGKKMCATKFMDETIEVVIETFHDTTYDRKLAAIDAIVTLTDICRDDLDEQLLTQLTTEILQSLPGKIWNGKTKLFSAIVHITEHCSSVLSAELKQSIVRVLLIEIQRSKIEYRSSALNAIGDVIRNLRDIQVLDECVPILTQISVDFDAKMQADIETGFTTHEQNFEIKQKAKKWNQLLCCCLRCIGNIWNGDRSLQIKYKEWSIDRMFIYYLQRSDWMVRVAIFKSIQQWCKYLIVDILSEMELIRLMDVIIEGFEDGKYAAIRHQSLCALYEIMKLIKCGNGSSDNNNNGGNGSGRKQGLFMLNKEFLQKIRAKVENLIVSDPKPIVVQQAIKLKTDIFL